MAKDGSTISNISWPSHISLAEKEFFATFYQFLDGTTPEEGKAWGETFASDGEFRAFGKIFRGPAATENHIINFWKSFPGLKHQPLTAYTYDPAGCDLIILTNYEMTCPNGTIIKDKSAAHFILKEVQGQYRIDRLTLYMDPQVLANIPTSHAN